MLDTAFASPIVVLVGMGFPLEIKGVMDAVRYMDGQPAQSRDEAFHATYGACRDALEGNASVAEARCAVCPGPASRCSRRGKAEPAGLRSRRRLAGRLIAPATERSACFEELHRLSPINDEHALA